jgi:hypothetical protein
MPLPRWGGLPDMAGHATALLGAPSFGDPNVHDQVQALEKAVSGSWTWRPVEKPPDIMVEPARATIL